jgi:hypothetical protein
MAISACPSYAGSSPTRQIGSKLFDRAEVKSEARSSLFVQVNSNGHSCFVRRVVQKIARPSRRGSKVRPTA